MLCDKCKTELPEDSKFCLKCGEEVKVEEVKYEGKQEKKSVNKTRIIIISLIILTIIIATTLVFLQSQKTKEHDILQTYEQELQYVFLDMVSQAAIAEEIVGKYINVWGSAIGQSISPFGMSQILGIEGSDLNDIYEDVFGDKYMSISKGDFNLAIRVVQEHYTRSGDIESLENTKVRISDKMRELNNPPDEYVKAYEIAFELHTLYRELVSLAVSPTGSLVSFKEKISKLISDIIPKVKEFEIRLP